MSHYFDQTPYCAKASNYSVLKHPFFTLKQTFFTFSLHTQTKSADCLLTILYSCLHDSFFNVFFNAGTISCIEKGLCAPIHSRSIEMKSKCFLHVVKFAATVCAVGIFSCTSLRSRDEGKSHSFFRPFAVRNDLTNSHIL